MVSLRRALPTTLALALLAGVSLTALAPLPSGTRVTDNAVLAEQLTPAEIPDFLTSHYGLAAEALDRDPAVVATWWQSLTDTARGRLTVRMPEIVGTLAGVDFAARDAANRVQLKRYLSRAIEAHGLHPQDPELSDRVLALQAITGALNTKSVPRYLVQLTSDPLPLAAIAVGNLDTARMVTYAVPGMGTYTTDMQLWTRAALNIYESQSAAGAPRRAVVAWVGYRTPPVGIEATRDAYAERGAHLLQRDILGLRASRGDDQPIVNIVGHSYGATTAAKALEPELGIRSFVMLGSAGVDRSFANADALSAELVFSGEASADTQARWGRVDRSDPNNPAFGAKHLTVEGSVAAGLRGVTGHEPILHSPWNDNPESPAWTKYADADERARLFTRHQESFGYLDASTQSLTAVGLATTPPSVRGRSLGDQ